MITVHCLVKNEENFIWFAINSVIDNVDKVIVWDTGSSDRTVEIIKTIKSPKIEFEEKGKAGAETLVQHRQEMIDQTETDWIMILDGDEVWWDDTIKNLKLKIKSSEHNLIVSSCYMAVGDIFHYQEEEAGRYKIHDMSGHLNIRFIRNFPGLKVSGVYPNEAYTDSQGKKLQNFPKEKIFFSEEKYLHLSHLLRSNKKRPKYKYELGMTFPKDFYYPEVFFRPRPEIVPSPWKVADASYKFVAGIETPIKKIKRRLI